MNKKYVNNLETSKIELHFTKEEYQNLTEDLKKELKKNYLFSRYANAWVSRSKRDHYCAIKAAKKLGFTEEEIKGEKLSFEDELNIKAKKAENRSARYEKYSENAIKKAENLQKDFNQVKGDIAFITQPNINSSGGRNFTNRRNKIMSKYEKGFEEYRKSEYFKNKAEIAERTANKTQLKDKIYLCNRIKECKSIIRKYEKYIKEVEEKQLQNNNIDLEKNIEKYLRELEYQIDKQAFLENCLEELGGMFDKEDLKEGYLINARHGWMKVEKINAKTVLAEFIEDNGLKGIKSKVEYGEIKEIKIPKNFTEKKEEIKNLYNVNDILVMYNMGGKKVIEAFQIIKTTAKGATLKKINIVEGKPIKDSFVSEELFRKKITKSNYSDFVGYKHNDYPLYLYN